MADKPLDVPNADPPIDLPMPPEPDGRSVEDQIADMERRVAEGKPLYDEPKEEEDAVQVGEAEEVDVGEQAGDGEEVGEGEEGDSAEGEDAEGEEEEGTEGSEEEGEEEDVDEEETEAEEEAEDEEDDEEDLYKASIPGRRPGDPDLELEIAGLTQAEQEGLNRLRNGYLRGEDYRSQMTEVNDLRTEVEAVAYQMDVNPVGYINETLEEETKVELAKFLLTQDPIFEKVFPDVEDWGHDQSRREGEAAKIERDQLKKSQDAMRRRATADAARKEGDAIIAHLEGQADDLSETNQKRFMRFAIQDLEDYAKANPKTKFSLENVNRILTDTGVFETFGIKPSLPTPTDQEPPPKKERIRKAKAKVQEARDTGKRFQKKRARKRSAASTSPPGSGAPPVSHPFKKGETIEERIAHIEKHGLPRNL